MDKESKDLRIEHDSMGEIEVPADRLWGAQTERSRRNFKIGQGHEMMPREIIDAFALLKKAAALTNAVLCPAKMTEEKKNAIIAACDKILEGELYEHFPLVVFQTGSGTQSNMNVNEVIANFANQAADKTLLHPNDDVNMSQSSNDTFPTAMHIAATLSIKRQLLPALDRLIAELCRLEKENEGIVKIGRTHLEDATPLLFSQEISGWRASLEIAADMTREALRPLSALALGGTAVGTGLNAPKGFDVAVAEELSRLCGEDFKTAENKFHALSSKSEVCFTHGALRVLAADLFKIANDVRWLASGPRAGLAEISIPENEPGSSIMPGKVNPTQCEALTMVALQVMANDAAVQSAAANGNFQLNVYMPLCIYNFLQSVRLLSEAIESFRANCVAGILANRARMEENLSNSLMLVTALSPHIGYENAAKAARLAHSEGISLKAACLRLSLMDEATFDRLVVPADMVRPK